MSVSKNEGRKTVLLAADDATAAALRRVLQCGVGEGSSDALEVQVHDERAPTVVRAARQRHGGLPLGYVAEDEEAAMQALSEGADEVLVWPPRDDHAVLGFLDRTRLRAGIRKQHESSRAAMAHAEKLAALGTLVAGVAHEVNNPLTALQLSVEALNSSLAPIAEVTHQIKVLGSRTAGLGPEQLKTLSDLLRNAGSPREVKELLGEMMVATNSISNVVKDLRVFARADGEKEEPRIADANDVVDQALRLVWRELSLVANIERDYAPDLPRLVLPQSRLTQVLINILVNAAQAVSEIERPAHSVRVSTRADEEFVAISVSDTGPGIADDGVEHIFDPFFTTKRSGMGTGLGLSISRAIMVELGGDLIVESVHGTGATFVALLPIPDRASVRDAFLRSSKSSTPPSSRSRRSILVLDDDERILRAYSRLLGRSCNVILAGDGREAIDLLRTGSKVDAIVSELSLPEVDGPALFKWLLLEQPGLAERTLFVTADSTRERYTAFLSNVANEVLTKPVDANSLLHALERTASKFEPAI